MINFLTLYYTYIVECVDGSYYVGLTKNLEIRIRQHNSELPGGAKYTRGRRPVTLQYYEEHFVYKDAARREVRIKRLSRLQKKKLISAFFQ